METTIKLSLIHNYPLLPKSDWLPTSRLIGVAPNEAVLFCRHPDQAGRFSLAHLHDGAIEWHELQIDPELLRYDPDHVGLPVLMKTSGRLVLFVNMRIVYAVDTRLRILGEMPIVNDLPRESRLRTDRPFPMMQAGASDGDVVPLFFHDEMVGLKRYVAMLRVADDGRSAEWMALGDKLLFSCGRSDVASTELDSKLGGTTPILHDALWRNRQLNVYTIGSRDGYMRYGMNYFGLALFDEHRNLLETSMFERVPKDESRHRGRTGDFSTSARYCVITPFFAAADPWKKKQRLFDLDTRELHEVILPRGFSSYQVVEHAADTFWLSADETGTGRNIASCTAIESAAKEH